MKRLIALILLLLFLTYSTAYAANTKDADFSMPVVESETAVLMNADTGQILFQKDMDKRMYPASITKIMTGMLALEYGQLSERITISEDSLASVDSDSSNIALFSGEQITLEQALYALSVASANDAANVIAESIGGTIDDFIGMMNAAAQEAGAMNTQFTNPDGMPGEDHYTTAHDMALITAQALRVPDFTRIFSEKRYEIPPTNMQPETRIFNTSNRFLNGDMPYEGLLISKTGWTHDAQHTLVTAAQRNGTTLVAVVMKSSDSTVKWSDTVAMLDFGFEQFDSVTIPEKDILHAVPADLTLPGEGALEIDRESISTQDVSVLLPKGKSLEDVQLSVRDLQLDADNRVKISVCLELSTLGTPYVPEELLDTTVTASLQPLAAAGASSEDTTQTASKVSVFKIILTVIIWIISVLLLAFFILLIRREIIIRRRRRRKRNSFYSDNRRPRR